jgi:hypothetical protein
MEVKAVRGKEIDLATKFNNVLLKNKATYNTYMLYARRQLFFLYLWAMYIHTSIRLHTSTYRLYARR